MTELKKIKSRPFAFLKISCNRTLYTFAFDTPHIANPSQKQKSAILPTQKIVLENKLIIHNKKQLL